MANRDESSRGLLLVAGATFFWSLSGVFARWLPQVDPWTFNATRGLGLGIALLVWMAWEYRLGAIALFRQSDPVAMRRYSALRMEPAMILGGLGVYGLVRVTIGLEPLDTGPLLILLLMGVVQLAIPMVLYMRGARHVAAVQMVLITMADVVLNPLWVWIVHGEVPARSVLRWAFLVQPYPGGTRHDTFAGTARGSGELP